MRFIAEALYTGSRLMSRLFLWPRDQFIAVFGSTSEDPRDERDYVLVSTFELNRRRAGCPAACRGHLLVRGFKCVSKVFQWYFRGVFKCVANAFQMWLKSVLNVFKICFNGFAKVFQWYFKCFSKEFKMCHHSIKLFTTNNKKKSKLLWYCHMTGTLLFASISAILLGSP